MIYSISPILRKFVILQTAQRFMLDLNNLIKRLEHDTFLAIEWFKTNSMKLSKDECHLLVLGHKYENAWVKMRDEKICAVAKQKLLRIEIERNLNFDDHVISQCKKWVESYQC